jgi:hypothetical protein
VDGGAGKWQVPSCAHIISLEFGQCGHVAGLFGSNFGFGGFFGLAICGTGKIIATSFEDVTGFVFGTLFARGEILNGWNKANEKKKINARSKFL